MNSVNFLDQGPYSPYIHPKLFSSNQNVALYFCKEMSKSEKSFVVELAILSTFFLVLLLLQENKEMLKFWLFLRYCDKRQKPRDYFEFLEPPDYSRDHLLSECRMRPLPLLELNWSVNNLKLAPTSNFQPGSACKMPQIAVQHICQHNNDGPKWQTMKYFSFIPN